MDYFHDIASALQIYIIYLIVFLSSQKTELGNQKPGTVFLDLNPLNKKDSPFLDVPINWSNIARICSDADILVLMEKKAKRKGQKPSNFLDLLCSHDFQMCLFGQSQPLASFDSALLCHTANALTLSLLSFLPTCHKKDRFLRQTLIYLDLFIPT